MEKILVVDDDLGIQKQLKWSFSGYEVVFADAVSYTHLTLPTTPYV